MQLKNEYNLNNPLENEEHLLRDNYTIFMRTYGTITLVNANVMHTDRERALHAYNTIIVFMCETFANGS